MIITFACPKLTVTVRVGVVVNSVTVPVTGFKAIGGRNSDHFINRARSRPPVSPLKVTYTPASPTVTFHAIAEAESHARPLAATQRTNKTDTA